MKKLLSLLLIVFSLLTLSACGNVFLVKVELVDSQHYSAAEIQGAVNEIKGYFWRHFDGCTLLELSYAGDEVSDDYAEWAERHNADEVLVLTSSFWVGAEGGDGSLNPHSTYRNWKWILVRNGVGGWTHVDHGY